MLKFRLHCLVAAVVAFVLANVRAQTAPTLAATVTLHPERTGPVINRNIYGQFAEHLGRGIYEGIWVGEDSPIPNTRGIRNDTIAALKALRVPVLRWPGGCFADEYHWRDGIGPKEKRPSMINTHWGGVVENNHFGTHEFLDLCEIIGAEPYITGNLGSGTPQEMMEWVEYMTSPADSPLANLRRANGRDQPWAVHYFAVGNESWGCGGNMRPEYYADEFRRYNTFVKNYPGNRISRIACGPNEANYDWTEVLMKNAARQMNGLALHYYTLPTGNWTKKGAATGFGEDQWFATMQATLKMDELISKHSAIMDHYDAARKVGLVVDEWGTWYDATAGSPAGFLEQQNSLRDAIVAAVNLHIFQAHAERVTMANIAQMVNVLQAMILTDHEKLVLTPTYHAFEMLKVHQGATALPLELKSPMYTFGGHDIPACSASASRDPQGVVHISLVNTSPASEVAITCSLRGVAATHCTGRVLTSAAMDAHNTFADPHAVEPAAFRGASIGAGTLRVTLPAKSVVVLELN